MTIPEVNFQELISDLQRGETMQLTETDLDVPGIPITNEMKSKLEDVARAFETFSYDFAPRNEAKKFAELLEHIAKSIY